MAEYELKNLERVLFDFYKVNELNRTDVVSYHYTGLIKFHR